MVMPRGIMLKVDILARMYKLKTDLYEGGPTFSHLSEESKYGAHEAINRVLDVLQEYRE